MKVVRSIVELGRGRGGGGRGGGKEEEGEGGGREGGEEEEGRGEGGREGRRRRGGGRGEGEGKEGEEGEEKKRKESEREKKEEGKRSKREGGRVSGIERGRRGNNFQNSVITSREMLKQNTGCNTFILRFLYPKIASLQNIVRIRIILLIIGTRGDCKLTFHQRLGV